MKFLTSLAIFVLNLSVAFSAAVKTARNSYQRFQLDITWETKAPDGYSRPQILINGQSPGPLIHVTQGDNVEVSETDALSSFLWLIQYFF
jgi:FtsP/CotA-like multicopper oxidase with cupredoxin domain